MAELVPFDIAEHLISALRSRAWEEIKLAKGAKQELNKLRETITSIHAVLQEADEHQQKNKLVQEWIRRLRDVLYEADDLLDEVATESLRQKVDARGRLKREVHDFFSSSNQLVSRVKMGHQIKKIREKLDRVAKDMFQFNFLPNHKVVVDRRVINNTRETDSTLPKDELIGREKSEKDIIQLLKQPTDQNSENVSIVAIVGMGGLGKTTLAQKVYNDEWVKRHFTKRMWICVSEDFNVNTLVKRILQCLMVYEVNDLDLEQLQSCLRENLEGKTYLLVLDDVWNDNEERWDRLKRFLFYGAQGSKILVTTRSKKVASVMGVDVETNSLYELKGLSDEESCILFEQKAFRGRADKTSSARGLLEIGKELVIEKCKGVPLAIKTLASTMRSYPDEAYWLSIKENDQMWSLPSSGDDSDNIVSVLKLSYYHLPNQLKQCFAYCSVFPKDQIILKKWLVILWLAQGYIQSSAGGKDLEEIGDMYFHELLSRSFFQDAKQNMLGNIETIKMHDLIHDLAQLISREDYFISSLDKGKKVPERVHHVVFNGNVTSNEAINILKPISKVKYSLRTLRFLEHVEKEESKCNIPDFVFLNFKYLRVLYLRFHFAELPSSIGNLKHLRCLVLIDFKFKRLPDTICDLLNLQSLILFRCYRLEELPKGLRKLVNLRHLIIEWCGNVCFPMGIKNLTWLRDLPTIFVARDNRYVLNELSGLDLLRGELCLKGLENVRDVESEASQVNLKGKKCLQCLRLTWSHSAYPLGNCTMIEKDESLLDTLEPHPNLKAMFVNGYGGKRFSSWLTCITNLVHLAFDYCYNCKQLPPLDQLKSLKHLTLSYMKSLEYVELSPEASSSSMATTNGFFPSLVELNIKGCDSFRGWWTRSNDDKYADVDIELQPCIWFPCLSRLSVFYCSKLSSMPLFPTLEEQLLLCGSNVQPLQQTMKMKMKMTNTNAASSSSCFTSPLIKLKHLELSSEDLESATLSEEGLRHLTALETLKISDCPRLTSLPDSFHHLSSLQRLSISRCEELSERCRKDNGPDWWKIQHIPNISTDFEKIGEW